MMTHRKTKSEMNRKGGKGQRGGNGPRQRMQNPMGMPEGGIPPGQFLGIGNPNGAVINFNTAELEDELADLLGRIM